MLLFVLLVEEDRIADNSLNSSSDFEKGEGDGERQKFKYPNEDI